MRKTSTILLLIVFWSGLTSCDPEKFSQNNPSPKIFRLAHKAGFVDRYLPSITYAGLCFATIAGAKLLLNRCAINATYPNNFAKLSCISFDLLSTSALATICSSYILFRHFESQNLTYKKNKQKIFKYYLLDNIDYLTIGGYLLPFEEFCRKIDWCIAKQLFLPSSAQKYLQKQHMAITILMNKIAQESCQEAAGAFGDGQCSQDPKMSSTDFSRQEKMIYYTLLLEQIRQRIAYLLEKQRQNIMAQ